MRPFPQIRDTRSTWKKDLSARHEFVLAVVLPVAPRRPHLPPSRQRHPKFRNGVAGRIAQFFRNRFQHRRSFRDLECQRSVRRLHSVRHHYCTAGGVCTAPADLPPGGTVQVRATSEAETSKSASAAVTVTSDIPVSLSPDAASVELGASQSFQAAIKSQGLPDPAIRWSLSGASCRKNLSIPNFVIETDHLHSLLAHRTLVAQRFLAVLLGFSWSPSPGAPHGPPSHVGLGFLS
jgi:hypothetical protein